MSALLARDGKFFLDGEPFQLIAGAIHYFRVPRAYWRDRLEKLVALGCNTVETYVPWNLHEPHPGKYQFAGGLDVEAFLKVALELGLYAIVRPSPYICAEFEFGGQPWWLLRDPCLRVRTTEAPYGPAVAAYYRELIPKLAALQHGRGGNIIACQVENEYGYYGNDKGYLRFLKDLLVQHGMECLLFTTDGPWGEALESGSLEGVLRGGSFGSGAPEHFKKMKATRPDEPLFCSEFWMGWFDAWGEEHHTRNPEDAARSLDEILAEGHVNLYMFHGGTNFGMTSGANLHDVLKPDVTSYDYDAPLSECGDFTSKYHAFRRVIAARVVDKELKAKLERPLDSSVLTTSITKKAFGALSPEGRLTLDAALVGLCSGSRPLEGPRPYSMEELGFGTGYVLYRLSRPGPAKVEQVKLKDCRDRATVYVNGKFALSLADAALEQAFSLELPLPVNLIDVLVENQGRVNFGHDMNRQRKGILGDIILEGHAHSPVESWPLPLDCITLLNWPETASVSTCPVDGCATFSRFRFECRAIQGEWHDSFLRLDGWGKGLAWVNGHALGRFFVRGPQRTLYVPGPFLIDGSNEIVIFETEGQTGPAIELTDKPDLG